MITINAMGENCPIPVIKTKKAIQELNGAGIIKIYVDNEIAVQNLMKMAKQKEYHSSYNKIEKDKFSVEIRIGTVSETNRLNESVIENRGMTKESHRLKNKVAAIGTDCMGQGEKELGRILMKGFLYALLEVEERPKKIIFYNSGVFLTCEGSQSLEDLKALEEQGVEILSCGTCLNFYSMSEKLRVGTVTNMYVIAESMTQADAVIKP